MKIERLISMVNDISNFFNADTDKAAATEAVSLHLMRSWEPRMRKQIVAYALEDGSQLSELAKLAVLKLPRAD